MWYFGSFIVFFAGWYSKVSLQFLCRFLGRLSWAASQTLDNFVFSRFHLRISAFVRIAIVVRGIRIQIPFGHRTLGTSFPSYTIFHRFHGFREFSSLNIKNAKIQIQIQETVMENTMNKIPIRFFILVRMARGRTFRTSFFIFVGSLATGSNFWMN